MSEQSFKPKNDTHNQTYTADPSTLTTQLIWREIGSLKELLLARIIAVENGIILAHEDVVRFPNDLEKSGENIRIQVMERMVGEIANMLSKIQANRDFYMEKFTGVQVKIDGNKKEFDAKMIGEHELKEEKFKKVDQRFELIEQSRVEQKKDTSDAVDRALRSAREAAAEQQESNQLAINKSELSITKQIDQQSQSIAQISKSLDEKINDIKDRVTRVEASVSGISSIRADIGSLKIDSSKGEGKDEGKTAQRAWTISFISIGISIVMFLIALFAFFSKFSIKSP